MPNTNNTNNIIQYRRKSCSQGADVVDKAMGAAVRVLRSVCGLSIEQLSLRIGKSQHWTAAMESGGVLIKSRDVLVIADALGASPAALFAISEPLPQ